MPEKPKFELFRQTPWRWVLIWLLLPNVVVIAMWPIGGPEMAIPLMTVGGLSIYFSSWESALFRRIGMVVNFLIVLATYTTRSFNIDLQNIWRVGEYLSALNIAEAPEYVVAGFLLAGSLIIGLYYAPRSPKFSSKQQMGMAVVAIALLMNIDTAATFGVRGSYKATAPAGTPIEAAMISNTITPKTVKADNLVVIIVESWGVPSNAEDAAVDDATWNPAQWIAKYNVQSGTSKYFGSTTNAELREWCGVWADHESFDFDASRCLPEQFREAGFRTVALHSFNREFFGREEWYPKLGFEEMRFDRELVKSGAEFCDGVFAGACDRDVPKQIGDILRASSQQKNLVYWLTVNAHLPVSSDPALRADKCTLGTSQWRKDNALLCKGYQVHDQVAGAITAEIMRADFPESDILIVGDHMPPYFPRHIRSRFDAAHVPWLYLEAKSASAEK